MTSKVSTETVTPKKSVGDDLNYSFKYVYDEKFAHRLVSAGDRHYKYDSNGNVICEQDGGFDGAETETYHKITQEDEDVYSTDYAWGYYRDSSKKGVRESKRYRRVYTWNERNLLVSSVDSTYSTAYVYGQDGQRSNKYTQNSETLYFNKMWTLHTDSGNNVYGGQSSKHIYLGETRIVTKLNSGTSPTYQEEYYKQYYYHSDHLGSASLISDYKGDEYQRIEYTPYGESWVEKTQNVGLEYLPYKFTSKELDEETGLYYYGARYLDPKYSRWLSTDPVLGDYVSKNSRGQGGIFNTLNLSLYHYGNNNPIRYTDPSGESVMDWIHAGLDAVGFIPGIGDIADGVNAVLYLCEGDYSNAALSATSMVPVVGDAIGKGGKAVKYAVKHGDDFVGAGRQVLKHADDGLAKAVPNPNGKKGCLDHRNTIDSIKPTSANGQINKEVRFDTPNGDKTCRYADAVEVVDGKITKIHQAGKVNKNGLPVTRESKAIEDIMTSPKYNENPVPVYFWPYNNPKMGPIIYD